MNWLLSKKTWTRLLVVAGTFLVVGVVGLDVGLSNSAAINHALNCQTFRTENGDSSSGDSNYFPLDYTDKNQLKAYCDGVGQQVEDEGIVLLKNKNAALPLSSGSKVSLLGQPSINFNYSTSGSSSSDSSNYPTLSDAMGKSGFVVNPALTDFYTSGAGKSYKRRKVSLVYFTNEVPWSAYGDAEKDSIAAYSDAAIVTFARNSGEGQDISTAGSDGEDGSYLSISPSEEELLKELTILKQAGKVKKIIVLLNMAVPMEMDFLYRSGIDVDACLWVGNVGSTGVYGIGDVLSGKVAPSGRLADTFCRDDFSSPAMASWILNPNLSFSQKYSNFSQYSLNSTQSYYGVYNEGIYVGYRYYETRYEDTVLKRENVGPFSYGDAVAYPFGYGLSYTTFGYDNFAASVQGDSYRVSLNVTNTGNVAGKDVVEIYLQKPYSDYDAANKIEKASVELVGFAKTSSLMPGSKETVVTTVKKEELKSYDSQKAGTYVLDEGKYYLAVGRNAHDAINNILALKGKSVSDGMDSPGDATLSKVILDNPALDAKTYSVSSETGEAVTNQLDFADINRYDGKGTNGVSYLSRDDWAGTWPKTSIALSVASQKMASDLESGKAIVENGEEMPIYGKDSGLNLVMLRSTDKKKIPYSDDAWESLLNQMSFSDQAYLLTHGGYGTVSISSVAKPSTKDNDGPTGVVGSANSFSLPSECVWAATFNTDLVEKIGNCLADDALNIGITSLYAPGVNIHRTPFGGRAHEYFSEDPFLSGYACAAEAKGLQEKGVVPTVKHFAFNDEETNRNGISIWLNEQEAREIMLKPFETALRPSEGNAHAIMTSFNRVGCLWVSASSNLMMNIVRNEWNFDGYSITDMASSNAGSYMVYDDGIVAGTDLFLGSGSETSLNSWSGSPAFAQFGRHVLLYLRKDLVHL